MVRKAGLVLLIVALAVNFFQPVVAVFPHRGGAWMAPWPMGIAQAGIRAAYPTMEELERWVLLAMVGWLFSRFTSNLERTLELINDIYRPWADR